jgi:predicted nucleic acid-binding Zn ribbon protein
MVAITVGLKPEGSKMRYADHEDRTCVMCGRTIESGEVAMQSEEWPGPVFYCAECDEVLTRGDYRSRGDDAERTDYPGR